ncbi:hypothetical protein [Leptolyngbya sp. NM2-A1]|uniref:hypothetical protein n=1 Tax=unclassified Leptolyngbya TaxID=2650499 RepID=UPI001995880D|nr:hypothetical protein [Leptolyngbya sp. FACHB-8]
MFQACGQDAGKGARSAPFPSALNHGSSPDELKALKQPIEGRLFRGFIPKRELLLNQHAHADVMTGTRSIPSGSINR